MIKGKCENCNALYEIGKVTYDPKKRRKEVSDAKKMADNLVKRDKTRQELEEKRESKNKEIWKKIKPLREDLQRVGFIGFLLGKDDELRSKIRKLESELDFYSPYDMDFYIFDKQIVTGKYHYHTCPLCGVRNYFRKVEKKIDKSSK